MQETQTVQAIKTLVVIVLLQYSHQNQHTVGGMQRINLPHLHILMLHPEFLLVTTQVVLLVQKVQDKLVVSHQMFVMLQEIVIRQQ